MTTGYDAIPSSPVKCVYHQSQLILQHCHSRPIRRSTGQGSAYNGFP